VALRTPGRRRRIDPARVAHAVVSCGAPCYPGRVRPLHALALLLVGTGAIGTVAFSSFTEPKIAPPATRPEVSPDLSVPAEPVADWCAPGYEAIAGGCLALSATAPAPVAVLVYLHGRYEENAAAEEVDRQRRLATSATARGFAVLALRGRLGECTWAELSRWFCWPSNERNARDAPDFVDAWEGALLEAHRRAGSKRRFVLGFSNGAYYAGLLATRGLFDADAFAIAHGGPVEPVATAARMAPLLLLSADEDVAQDDMIRLDEDLTREHWPHDSYARAGPHGLTDSDIDAALTFFARSHEPLPLEPPLALHRPAHHPHEETREERDL
jgi:predicted esterase